MPAEEKMEFGMKAILALAGALFIGGCITSHDPLAATGTYSSQSPTDVVACLVETMRGQASTADGSGTISVSMAGQTPVYAVSPVSGSEVYHARINILALRPDEATQLRAVRCGAHPNGDGWPIT